MKTPAFTLKAYTAALFLLICGILLSIRQSDWSWFSRSGSLVVVNGIVLTSHQIIEHMQNLTYHQNRNNSQFNRDYATSGKQNFIHNDPISIWRSEKYGLYMLVLGTLIWGFGDLPNLL